MTTSRLQDRLLEVIGEVREEINDEWDADLRESEMLGADETGTSFMEGVRKDLTELIQGRTLWFDHEGGLAWRGTGSLYQNDILEMNKEDVQMILSEAFIQNLDALTDRLAALPTIRLAGIPCEKVRSSLDHATRCYLYGLLEPSAALCRAALEAALDDRVPKSQQESTNLEDRINQAHRLNSLTNSEAASAHRIRQMGNHAAHGRHVQEAVVKLALQDLKAILENLYGS